MDVVSRCARELRWFLFLPPPLDFHFPSYRPLFFPFGRAMFLPLNSSNVTVTQITPFLSPQYSRNSIAPSDEIPHTFAFAP